MRPIIFEEIDEIPQRLAASAAAQAKGVAGLARRWRDAPPRLVATIARGSSDHAATILRHAFERGLGVPTASLSPSIASVYGRRLDLAGALCLAVSQSGRSPDIVETARMAADGGGFVVAIVNDEASPLAAAAHHVIGIGAGEERAVAATKSFVGAVVCGFRLVSALAGDLALADGLARLPQAIAAAAPVDAAALGAVLDRASLLVLGRGPALGVAGEAALKIKEMVRRPAEAFSTAEALHGPWALVETGAGVIAWPTDPPAAAGQAEAVARMRAEGATVFEPAAGAIGDDLQSKGLAGVLRPLTPLPGFYRALAEAAIARGFDPDGSRLLAKVTHTR